MIAYKLFRQRKDGTLGPLFINARLRVPVGVWLEAEDHPTNGFARRPGWHCTLKPEAPHLSSNPAGSVRVWARVEIADFEYHNRPPSQGGRWVLAKRLKVIEIM